MARDPDDLDRHKIKVGVTTYDKGPRPVVLCDEEVFDRARMYYTAAEIAKRFNVTEETLMKHHAEAYNAGKDDACQKPRVLMGKIFRDFAAEEVNLARTDANTGILLKAIETKAKVYDGLGQNKELTVKGLEVKIVANKTDENL